MANQLDHELASQTPFFGSISLSDHRDHLNTREEDSFTQTSLATQTSHLVRYPWTNAQR